MNRTPLLRRAAWRTAASPFDAATLGLGLLVFLGIATGDGPEEARYLAEKVVNLRIFDDEAGRFNRSALDVGAELLLVSQFTLYADTRKGRRPSFTHAAPPADADKWNGTVDKLKYLQLD